MVCVANDFASVCDAPLLLHLDVHRTCSLAYMVVLRVHQCCHVSAPHSEVVHLKHFHPPGLLVFEVEHPLEKCVVIFVPEFPSMEVRVKMFDCMHNCP